MSKAKNKTEIIVMTNIFRAFDIFIFIETMLYLSFKKKNIISTYYKKNILL
jgi:hypothetical protein